MATLDVEGPLAVIPLPLTFSPGSRDRFVAIGARTAGTSGLRGLVRDCSGAVAVNSAVLLGPLLLLLLGTFDIGLMTLTATRIDFAVEAAARCGAIGAAMCPSPPRLPPTALPSRDCEAYDASDFVTTAACESM